jgi:hypothetical protein
MDHPPLLMVTDFGGHSPSYVGLSVSDYSSPVTGNESVRGEISFSRRLRSIGGGSITQSFGHSVRKRAQQAARTFRFAIARRRSSASRTVYYIFDCHEATKIGGGIRNIPHFRDTDHHAGQGRSMHHAVAARHSTAPSLLRTHGSVEVDATIQVGIRPHHSRASVEAGKAARAAISIAHLHQESMDIILHQLSIPGHGIGTEGGSVFFRGP